MNVNIPAQDSRNIEVLAQGLPCHGGVQLAVRCCLVAGALGQGDDVFQNLRLQAGASSLFSRLKRAEDGCEEAVQTMKMLAHSKARRRPVLHAVPSGSHVGKKVDENVWPWLALCLLSRLWLNLALTGRRHSSQPCSSATPGRLLHRVGLD